MPSGGSRDRGVGALVERGRTSYSQRDWTDVAESLSAADRESPLGAATSSCWRRPRTCSVATRTRCGSWNGRRRLTSRRATRRARRTARSGSASTSPTEASSVPRVAGLHGRSVSSNVTAGRASKRAISCCLSCCSRQRSGDFEGSHATGVTAAAIAERFGDADLLALATMGQGLALLAQGNVDRGLGRLDEAMVGVTAGELSPIVTGLIYCGLITGCHEVYELRRAHEWTTALTRWCDDQPDLVVYTGECLVHRAEVMQLHGRWSDALEEAERAGTRFALRIESNRLSAAQVCYRRGEVHRLRGEAAAAEAAYREASGLGWEPQPGLALLRLAAGDVGAASASIRRTVGEATEPARRVGLLPACIEIMLAAGEVEDARMAAKELDEVVAGFPSEMLAATAALRARCRAARGRRRVGRARPAAARKSAVAEARGTVRGGTRTDARGARLPASSATGTPESWSSTRLVPRSTSSARSRTSPRWSDRSAASRRPRAGSRRASARCSASSPAARATRPSRPTS